MLPVELCPPLHRLGPLKHRNPPRIGVGRLVEQADAAVLPNPARSRRPASRPAHIAGKAGQHDLTSDHLFSIAGALGPQTGQKAGGLRCSILPGQTADGLGGHAGDPLRPLRRPVDTVLLPEKIGRVALPLRKSLRHVLLVKTQAVPVHKGPVLQAL